MQNQHESERQQCHSLIVVVVGAVAAEIKLSAINLDVNTWDRCEAVEIEERSDDDEEECEGGAV